MTDIKDIYEQILKSISDYKASHIKSAAIDSIQEPNRYLLRAKQNNNKYITFELSNHDLLEDLQEDNSKKQLLLLKIIDLIKDFISQEYNEHQICTIGYNNDYSGVCIQANKASTNKSKLISLMVLLAITPAHADFSFYDYQYTLDNLRNQHLVNSHSHYDIEFNSVQTGGDINTYNCLNGNCTPVSYKYTLTRTDSSHGSLVVLHDGDDIDVFRYNESSSDILSMPATVSIIGTLSGDFIGNNVYSETQAGGLTNNAFTISNLYGDFIENYSSHNAGALLNLEHGQIGNIVGNFLKNNGSAYGGAIDNEAVITHMTANFVGNSAKSPSVESAGFGKAFGGGIYNAGNINNISGDFIDNRTCIAFDSGATSYVLSSGGGIYNGDYQNNGTESKIDSIAGNFIGNSATVENNYSVNWGAYNGILFAEGGAITNRVYGQIRNITSDFYGNITNINNTASISSDNNVLIMAKGGAIYNTGIIDNISGDFINNSASVENSGSINARNIEVVSQGGAIYNSGTIGLFAMDKSIVFSGNVAEQGGAIYNSGTITMNVAKNERISFSTSSDNIYNSGQMTMSGDGYFYLQSILGDGDFYLNGFAGLAENTVLTQDSLQINKGGILSINASSLDVNSISNYGALILTGGNLSNDINGSGNVSVSGDVTNEAYIYTNVSIEHNNSLTTAAIAGAIVNNGTLYLTGGSLDTAFYPDGTNTFSPNGNNITGDGKIVISGDVSGNANKFGNDIVNNNKLTLTGGTLNQTIAGKGTLITTGNVTIAPGNIGNVQNNILNNGTLTISDYGRLNTDIAGSGTVVIDSSTAGYVVSIASENNINNSIVINNKANLNSSANSIGGDIVNNGQLHLSGGVLEYSITGNGYTGVSNNMKTKADNLQTDIRLDGGGNEAAALTLTGGTLAKKITNGSNDNTVIISGDVVSNAGNLLTDIFINTEQKLTLIGDILKSDITGAGLVEIDGMVEIANNKIVDTNIEINTDKSLTASINSIGGAVINNGLLTLTDGGTLSGVISGSGNIVAKANVDKITTSADYLQNPLQLQSSATKVVLTDGTLNNKINGGSIVVAGNVNSHANNIGADVSNNGTFVLTGGTLTHHINGTGDFEIGSGTLTTNADMLQMSKITNNGVLDITSGILTQDVVGGKTIIADGAGICSKNIGDLELNGNMYVGNNTITATNTIINGTVNMDIEKISANSNEYVGGYLTVDNVSFGDSSKLNLTIYDTDLLKGESTGDISLITTAGDWSGSFGSIFQNNNRYSIAFDDTTKTFTITHVKIGADVIAEIGGTADDIAVASAWDELPSSTLPNVQYIIDEINHRSQHDTDGYLQLVKSLQPVKTNVVHGISRSLNNAINTQITERLTAVTPKGRNGGDTQEKTGIWAQGMYNKSNQSGAYGFDGNTIGMIAGFDTTFGANITMGAGYAFSTTDIEADMRSLEVDGHNLFIYGKYQGANWHINANLSYGMSDYTDNATSINLNNSRYARRVFPTQNTKSGGTSLSDSEYSTNTIGASALFGYGMSENLDINIGTRFNHITVDDYTDMAGQSVSVEDMDFMTVLGGFSYGKQGKNWTPVIHIAATYDVLSDDYIANVDLGGSGYVINGENIDPFGIEAGISLETNGDIWDFSIGYDIEWHSNFISHTGKAKLKYNF